MSSLILLSILLRHSAYAAPLNVAMVSDISTSVVSSDQSKRTIWNIVWSCLSTTIACTWVSIHPNMSFYEEGHWSVRNRRFLLTVLSLLAPELMVMWACKQWRGSLNIKEEINKLVKEDIRDDSERKVREWSQVHAHFLQMGGFKVIFTEDEKDDFKNEMGQQRKDGHWECVVRFDTFKKLLQEKHIELPDITEDEINDKRKVDSVSKGLALLQLFWLIAQILARAFERLAITQLEITTAALATMNFVMYYFWWHKPLNAQYPVVIHSIGYHDRLNVKSNEDLKSRRDNRNSDRSKAACAETETDGMTHGREEIEAKGSNRCGETCLEAGLCASNRHRSLSQISRQVRNYPRRVGDCACQIWRTVDHVIRKCRIPKAHVPWLAPILLAIASVAFALANVALVIVTISLIVALPLDEIHRSKEVVDSEHTKTSKLHNWVTKLPGLSRMDNSIHGSIDYVTKVNRSLFYSEHATWTSRLFGIVAILAGAVFGAIHCLAWNFDFPSRTEENIWRVSSVVMIGVNIYVAVGVSALIKLGDCITGTLKFLFPEAELHCSPTLIAEEDALIFLSIVFSSVIHAVARVALIVLAIMSFSDLPPSAFEAIGWSNLIPHI